MTARIFLRVLLALALVLAQARVVAAQSALPTPIFRVTSIPDAAQFGQQGSNGTSPLSLLVGARPFVWQPSGPQAGVAMAYYVPIFRDPVSTVLPTNPHNLAYFMANHPDWPMWAFNASVASATVTPSTGGTGYGASATGTMTWSGSGCNVDPVLNVTSNSSGVITTVNSVTTAGSCVNTLPLATATTWTAGGGLSAGSGAAFTLVSSALNAPSTIVTPSSGCTPSTCTGGTVIPVASTAGVTAGNCVAVGTGFPVVAQITAVTANASFTISPGLTGSITTSTQVSVWCAFMPENDNLILLNINDVNARAYILSYAITNGVAAGFDYIGFDNVDADNPGVGGHYAGGIAGCAAGPPACGGIWTNTENVDTSCTSATVLVDGAGAIDPVWGCVMVTYLQYLHANLNALGVGMAGNLKRNKVNVLGSLANGPGGATLAYIFDAVLDESPYLHSCTGSNTDFIDMSDGNWAANAAFDSAVTPAKPVLQLNYLCNHSLTAVTQPEASYGLANYYLWRSSTTMLVIEQGTGNPNPDVGVLLNYQNANGINFTQNIGAATESPPIVGTPNSTGGCYERTFAKGMVEVFPYNGVTPSTPTSCTYTVPSGHTWVDMFGNTVTPGVQTLLPDSSVSPARANSIVLFRTS